MGINPKLIASVKSDAFLLTFLFWELKILRKQYNNAVLFDALLKPFFEFHNLGVRIMRFSAKKLNVAILFITFNFMALVMVNDSMAQIKWDKSPDNPIFSSDVDGSWDGYLVNDPCVILKDGEYKMWYCGNDNIDSQIGYATFDGTRWNRQGAITITKLDGSLEVNVSNPCVIFDANINRYRMWYSDNVTKHMQISCANSIDGFNWTKEFDESVLKTGVNSWDRSSVWGPAVIYNADKSIYEMWYSGDNGNTGYGIGYATSPDGVNWKKHGTKLEKFLLLVWSPSIIYANGEYRIWYNCWKGPGTNVTVGYATSGDGENWNEYRGNPVLDIGNLGSWDDRYVHNVCVIKSGSLYEMWFGGNSYSDPEHSKIGYAISKGEFKSVNQVRTLTAIWGKIKQ